MWTLVRAAPWPIPKLVVWPLPERVKDGAQFTLPPKGLNDVEMLGEQHHHQYDAVCDVIIEQTNHELEDEIRAELMIHYGAVVYTSSTCSCHCIYFGQITDRMLPVMFKNIDEAF
jgi:hypothetical protein